MQQASPVLLSVVIPTCDRAASLRLCLRALQAAEVPGMECVVVDNGQMQGTAEVVKASSALACTLLRIEHGSGSAVARNAGAAVASGDILLFVDDDVCVDPASLAATLAAFQENAELGALIGRYDDDPADPGFLSQFRNLLHAYTHRTSAGAIQTFWTGFGAVRAQIFHQFGGFSEDRHAIDDVEFGMELSAAGVPIILRADLQVKHLKRWTLRTMVRTDFLLRGIPWTMLLWRQGRMPNTLNIRYRERLSVLLALYAVCALSLCAMRHLPGVASMMCLLLLVALNAKFYHFLQQRRGAGFAACGACAHFLYLLVAALSFCAGTALYLLNPSGETLAVDQENDALLS